ncbi:hypothetical protein VitviT2T_015512 [Vitis vinifera]|uniref:Uncharacterized protein n=1 Tax=Vitis vinifera TaxID=29760 RepID=A0ABY9CQ97_VITVI|nr:hypothetical protein VitviT2T_015512 [Vitis vinifera]
MWISLPLIEQFPTDGANIEALRHRGPRSRQMHAPLSTEDDSCFDQPAKDVWTGCSDTPSNGFVSLFSDNQSSIFLSSGRTIIALQAAVRNCEGDDLPSFLSFRSAGGGMQAVIGYLK